MSTKAPVSVEEYLATTYDPDCDYVDGELLERNMGEKKTMAVCRLLLPLGCTCGGNNWASAATLKREFEFENPATAFQIFACSWALRPTNRYSQPLLSCASKSFRLMIG